MALGRLTSKELIEDFVSKYKYLIPEIEDTIFASKLERICNEADSLLANMNCYPLLDTFEIITKTLSRDDYYKKRFIGKEKEITYREIALDCDFITKTLISEHKEQIKKEKAEAEINRKEHREKVNARRVVNLEEDMGKSMDLFKRVGEKKQLKNLDIRR